MKDDDLNDVIRQERSRGRRQPVDLDARRKQEERENEVLKILRRGTKQDFQALLEKWGYSKKEVEELLRNYDALRGQQSS